MTRLKIIAAMAGLIVLVFACASLTTGVNRLTSSWDVYYDSWDKQNSTVSIGVRNSTRKVQQFDPSDVTPEIEDAKGYKYSLQYVEGAQALVPPGGSLLVSFRYSMPANAPDPKLILKYRLLDIRRKTVSLASPQSGFSRKAPRVPEDLVLYRQGDVGIRVGRAWWDSQLVVVELLVSNQGGAPVHSSVLCEPVLWAARTDGESDHNAITSSGQTRLYDPKDFGGYDVTGTKLEGGYRVPPELGEAQPIIQDDPSLPARISSYRPLYWWTVPGYADARIYWVFWPRFETTGHPDFILSAYEFEQRDRLLIIHNETFRECHTTWLQVSTTRPSGAFSNDPTLGPPVPVE